VRPSAPDDDLTVSSETLTFELPDALLATEPPETHGTRDGVRLMVVEGTRITHTVFRRLASFLHAGDLLVVNTSATVAAAADGARAGGRPVVVHLANPWGDGEWLVEIRRPDQRGPVRDLEPGETITLERGAELRLVDRWRPESARLWTARFLGGEVFAEWMHGHGRPIAYGHTAHALPLASYQTVFARDPGSAEMPSAGRPFSVELIVELMARGVAFAPVLLHAGVSSLEVGELPPPERYRVGSSTARLINATRANGGRVIAIGTTVARAVETVAAPGGTVTAGSGWTELVLSPRRPAWAVDGLVTGWHEPRSTHLLLLDAIAGARPVRLAYDAALAGGYRWHEFGDSCLFLR
jgi:S-adenosylmethionine:tRNA ribosyltransferase-isomerase